ncbi:MAG: D-alanyl-D-alanine carboxypeptidase/D-alanyl-D-alanine endopeptidase [Nocardioidaceae bacterium]
MLVEPVETTEPSPSVEPVETTEPSDPVETPAPAGRRLRRVTASGVALVLVAAGAAYAFDLGPRWLGWDYPSPVTQPAEVAPPPGLSLPAARAPEKVAADLPAEGADPAAVRRALAPLVHDRKLGSQVAVRVAELTGPDAGTEVYRHGPTVVTPASTLKLLTTTAALSALGPDHRFTTRVVAGARAGSVTLVGGGDPLLARVPVDTATSWPEQADVQTLARATARALHDRGSSRVRLRYDDTLFSGPAVNPRWEPSYVPDNVVSPITALWVDEGRQNQDLNYRSADPSLAAAQAFAADLRKYGIRVVGRPVAKAAPARATELASVTGAPLAEVVQHVLEVSDNEGAEVLARQTAIATGRPATFAGGAAAVRSVLAGLGVDLTGVRTYDGSGLSRSDRVRPETELAVLEAAASSSHPALRTVVSGLPVAGFSGSLADRFQTAQPAGLGLVRAKTGTLTGVHGLSGTVVTKDGALLAFVAVADRVKVPNTLAARDGLDRIAAALAACTCAATP